MLANLPKSMKNNAFIENGCLSGYLPEKSPNYTQKKLLPARYFSEKFKYTLKVFSIF
jgi:hypothetical protein